MISILNEEIKIIKKNIQKKIINNKILEISDLIDVSNIINVLNTNKEIQYNDIKIVQKDNYFVIDKNINKEIIEVLNNNKILNEYIKFIDNSIGLNIDETIKSAFIFYFILIDLYNFKYIDKDELFEYLNIVNNNTNTLNRNYELCITNNLSIEINHNNKDSFIKGKNIKIKESIISLFNEIGLLLLEIPFNCNIIELNKFLEDILAYKNKYEINNMKFNLRFKKIKKYKKDGMYFVNANTIILDPRDIKAFKHELGHFLYENNISFLYNKSKVNPKNINLDSYKFIDKKHKVEDYNLNSENFAYWFENV